MMSDDAYLHGDKIFLCHASDGIQAVDLLTGAVEKKYRDGRNFPSGVASVGRTTRLLASAQLDKALIFFWERDEELPTYRASLPEKLSSIAFDGSAQLMLGGGASGRLFVWMLESGQLIKTWIAHHAAVSHIAFVGEDEMVVTAGADGVLKAYWMSSLTCDSTTDQSSDMPDVPACRTWSAHTQAITAMTGSLGDAYSSLFISSALDNILRVWSWESDRCISSFLSPTKVNFFIQDLLLLTIFACCDDGNIYLLPSSAATRQNFNPSAEDLRQFTALQGHSSGVRCGVVASGGRLVTCAADGIRIWDVRKKTTISHWPHFGSDLVAILIAPSLRKSQLRRIKKFGTFSARQVSVREARASLMIKDGGVCARRTDASIHHRQKSSRTDHLSRSGNPLRWALHGDIYSVRVPPKQLLSSRGLPCGVPNHFTSAALLRSCEVLSILPVWETSAAKQAAS